MTAHYEDVLADIRSRDARDSGRDVAPLKPATDAVLLDTSELTPDQAIAEALRLADQWLARARTVSSAFTVRRKFTSSRHSCAGARSGSQVE